jgi:hypothetical protein
VYLQRVGGNLRIKNSLRIERTIEIAEAGVVTAHCRAYLSSESPTRRGSRALALWSLITLILPGSD